MDTNALREHLAALHRELSSAAAVDERSKPLLGELMADIRRLMDTSGSPSAQPETVAPVPDGPTPGGYGSLPDRLERIAVQFEADHPTLAASSRRLVDLLGKAGL